VSPLDTKFGEICLDICLDICLSAPLVYNGCVQAKDGACWERASCLGLVNLCPAMQVAAGSSRRMSGAKSPLALRCWGARGSASESAQAAR